MGSKTSSDWKQLFRQREYLGKMRISATRRKLSSDELEKMRKVIVLVKPTDKYTKFNYDPELAFVSKVIASDGDTEAANEATMDIYPEVNFGN